MLRVKGTDIQLTRGDTAVLSLPAFTADCGKPYYFGADESVHVQVRTAPIESELTELVFDGDVVVDDSGVPVWMIPSEHSSIDAGVYYYDAQANLKAGQVCTYISGKLEILPEVTIYHG